MEKIKNMRFADAAFDVLLYVLGTLVLLVIVYPLYYVLIASFSAPEKVMSGQVWFWVNGFTLDGYKYLFEQSRIWIGYRNTVFYTIAGTTLSMFVTIPAGYALSRSDFKARKPLMIYFMITMYFSGGLIPTYLLIANTLHMDNTVWVMIVPFCLNVYNLIIVRSFFESSLPKELWEAAQLDGCSNTRYLITIAVPLSKAMISVIMLYYMVGKWNEYFNALMYTRDDNLTTLQLVLRSILVLNEQTMNDMTSGNGLAEAIRRQTLVKYTSIIVATLPMLILYPFLQKYFDKGVMLGAIKG